MPYQVSPLSATYRTLVVVAGAVIVAAISACQAPFGLGEPSTKALENGVADSLAASSLEISGSYTEAGDQWSITLQVTRPATKHVIISKSDVKLEAVVINGVAYFRGNQFLAQHMGSDPIARNLVKAAGNAWWKGAAADVPSLPDLTDPSSFRSTFLGTAVSKRTDHVVVDGLDVVQLSGPRADVFVASDAPHRLVRVRFKQGAAIDGVIDADLGFSFAVDFRITAPTDVIDFSNLSTLPPIYTVVSVDTSRCGTTCVVSALLKNLGGKIGAQAPSTITFTMTDSATKASVGSCQSQVQPDVGYNATTTVSCTITLGAGSQANAAIVTAAPENPGRA